MLLSLCTRLIAKEQFLIDQLAMDFFHIDFPTNLTLSDMKSGITQSNILRYAKEGVEKEVKLYASYWQSVLTKSGHIPSGKTEACLVLEVLKIINDNHEIDRVSANEKQQNEDETAKAKNPSFELPSRRADFLVRKEFTVYETQQIRDWPPPFLTFILLGPPSGEKCHSWFRLGSQTNADGSSATVLTKRKDQNLSRGAMREDQHNERSQAKSVRQKEIEDVELMMFSEVINIILLSRCFINMSKHFLNLSIVILSLRCLLRMKDSLWRQTHASKKFQSYKL